MSEVANAGGASAFSAPGTLSTSATDYASLDTPGGLQAYFNTGASSFIGSVSIGSSASGIDTTANTSPTSKPFSNAYTLLVTGSTQEINTSIGKVQQLIHPYLTAALVIALCIVAIATMFGRTSINGLFSFVIRMSIVLAFVVPGSSFYANYVVTPVQGLPSALAKAIGGPTLADAGPAGVFDESATSLWIYSESIFNATHVSWSGAGIGVMIAGILLWALGFLFLWIIFLPYLAVNFIFLLMLVFGPIAILFALFKALDKYLMGFVDVLATLAALTLGIDIVITINQAIMVKLFNGLGTTSVPDKDIPSFAGLVGSLAMLAFITSWYLVPFMVRIFSGAGIGMMDGAAFLAGAATRAVRFGTGK